MIQKKAVKFSFLIVLLSVFAILYVQHQAVQDWIRLHGYTPPETISQLASDDTMTPFAQHLFFVNRPDITSGTGFTSHCPSGGEKTVVLGCYVGNDAGIFLYNVTDSRLMGVEQVTAAHETLHAAYRRLSSGDRAKVNTWLVDYYEHGLTDERIKDTIAAYKKSEPNDVVNEMHSVFGTEVKNLPTPLENYYKRYFTNRSVVTGYTAKYQAEFTLRQNQIADYDTQLSTLKKQIDDNQSTIDIQKDGLNTQSQQLQAKRSSGDITGYNSGVNNYNSSVNTYNALIQSTKNLIGQYNGVVAARNAVVLEEQQLSKALSDTSLNTK